MTVLIEDPETDRIVRELAERMGETITEAVRKAAKLRLETLPQQGRSRLNRAALAKAQACFAALPSARERVDYNEILGYNDEGHFD